jgi:hypothetical protein
MSKYLAISNESAWEKLSQWHTNSSNLLLRFRLVEASGHVPVRLAHWYEGDRIILRREAGGTIMFLLSGASFETESEVKSAVDSLVIRYPSGGYCIVYELAEPDQWPDVIGDIE